MWNKAGTRAGAGLSLRNAGYKKKKPGSQEPDANYFPPTLFTEEHFISSVQDIEPDLGTKHGFISFLIPTKQISECLGLGIARISHVNTKMQVFPCRSY